MDFALQVQYPGAEGVMMSDLRNLKVLAWFLQKFELDFDILSSLRELSKQIRGEFDFRWASLPRVWLMCMLCPLWERSGPRWWLTNSCTQSALPCADVAEVLQRRDECHSKLRQTGSTICVALVVMTEVEPTEQI